MPDESNPHPIFRFVQLRKPAPGRIVESVHLVATKFASDLANRELGSRITQANTFLTAHASQAVSLETLPKASVLADTIAELQTNEAATLQDVLRAAGGSRFVGDDAYLRDRDALSDLLLATKFCTEPRIAALAVYQRVYRVMFLIHEHRREAASLEMVLADAIQLPIFLPPGLTWSPPTADDGRDARRRQQLMECAIIGDLLVVRSHVERYEPMEIAHVENVMSGEKRSREVRNLDRFEEELTFETERTRTTEEEMSVSETNELKRETERTIKDDYKFGFDLSISGKYGPTVEFGVNTSIEESTSTETSSRSSTNFAKEVIERSLKRVEERVLQRRTTRMIRETEETNTHSFESSSDRHRRGVYQFLDKILRAQIFNYGRRLMFDFVVPDPAHYLRHVDASRTDIARDELEEPPKFTTLPHELVFSADASGTNSELYYGTLAARYGATVSPPPEEYKTVSGMITVPRSDEIGAAPVGSPSDESGEPVMMQTLELGVPTGYRPIHASIGFVASTNRTENVRVAYSVGRRQEIWSPAFPPGFPQAGALDLYLGAQRLTVEDPLPREDNLAGYDPLDREGKLPFNFLVTECSKFSITVNVRCRRTEREVEVWQLTTHRAIQEAYEQRLMEYRSQESARQAQKRAEESRAPQTIGVSPTQRVSVIQTELKKHCLSLMFHPGDVNHPLINPDLDPPRIRTSIIFDEGLRIRFLEQAFEWQHLQYAFYPYFWGRPLGWANRLRMHDADYEFQQFLQAGAARAVVPVRPGFEAAVCHFIETGIPWNGAGVVPDVGDPLYVSIADELRSQTGGDVSDGVPVGQPWEIRLPTTHLWLRRDDALPRWEKVPDETWQWQAVDEEPTA